MLQKLLNRFDYLNHLIRTQKTGTPVQLAGKLGISQRTWYKLRDELVNEPGVPLLWKNSKNSLVVFVILLFSNITYAQMRIISGNVRSSTDSSALPFANIYIKNQGIGTYTNEAGAFELHITEQHLNDTIAVSFLGFASGEIIVKDALQKKQPIQIFLKSEPVKLAEVSAKGDTAYRIVKKAFKLIRKNYPTRQYYLDTFYRELCLKDDKYTRLIEAAVGIQDYGFDALPEERKIKILELRKSEDYIERGWISKVADLIFGKTSSLVVSLRLGDFLRKYRTTPNLNPANKIPFDDYYEFKLNRLDYFGGDKVYVIDIFLPAAKDVGQFAGSMIINQKDYAIIHMEWMHGAPGDYKDSKSGIKKVLAKAYMYKHSADYRMVNGKYYLSKLESIYPVNFDAINKELGQGMQFYNCFLIVNNVYTKKSEFDRVKRRDELKDDMDLYDQDFTYNEAFWKNYNILLINPLLKKAITDLEKDKSLEDQFKQQKHE